MAQLKNTTVNGTLTLNGENVGSKLSTLSDTVDNLKTTYTNELTSLDTKITEIRNSIEIKN